MGTDYRAGLPPIEAAAAHEERTQHAQWMRRRPATADCPIASTPEITALPARHWSYILSSGEDYAKWEFCPVSDDGEMMPWPGGPDPVDSLRKALAISDERVRDLTARLQLPANLRKALTDFQRNGRWGACVFCTGTDPAACEYTDRYDHLLRQEDLDRILGHHLRTRMLRHG